MGIITDRDMQSQPGAVDQWITEDAPRGTGRFLGRITPSGERAFYFRYTTASGGRDTLRIGGYHPKSANGALTVAQARAQAAEWRIVYACGERDLRQYLAAQRTTAREREEAAKAQALASALEVQHAALAAAEEQARRITVEQLFDRWRTVDLQPHVRTDGRRAGRKDGGAYTQAQFRRHVFPSIGHLAATEVRKAELLTILDAAKSAGKLRTCNVLLSDLRQMYAFALTREIVERNPLNTVQKRHAGGADSLRERVLSEPELKNLAALIQVSGLSKRSVAAVWLLLATGARIGELMGSVWADKAVDLATLAALPQAASVQVGLVDVVAKTWHLPTTKNERSHTIPLSDFALRHFETLAELREVDSNSTDDQTRLVPWIFPNVTGSGPVDVKSFGKQLADRQRTAPGRLQGRSKQTVALVLSGGKWTAHDLRRTAATIMSQLGISGDVIDECLNHMIESRVRRTYIRDRREAQQVEAFDKLGRHLQQLTKKEDLQDGN